MLTIYALFTVMGCGGDGGPGGSDMAATLELEAAYPEPFSYLSGVRELPGGTLLAADPLSQVLVRLDMDTGAADTLGGVGGGPEEYQQPDQVFPLPGDSTLLVDLGKTYLTVIGPDGGFHDGMSMALPTEDGSPSIILPRTVDTLGRIYFEGMGGMGAGPQDSASISRYDRTTGTIEVVGKAWQTPPVVTRSGDNISMSLVRMAPNDDWAVGPDGRVAVIRANGYYVEWLMPGGEVVTGPETPFQARTISYSDKEANLEETSTAGLGISISRNSAGATSMQMSRGGFGMGGDEPAVEDQTWAETFPPFRTRRTVVSPTDHAWVERWLPVDQEPRIDIFGPDGVRKGSVAIPRNRRLIGFGEGPDRADVAYFVRTDEVDLQWLERYRVVWE